MKHIKWPRFHIAFVRSSVVILLFYTILQFLLSVDVYRLNLKSDFSKQM